MRRLAAILTSLLALGAAAVIATGSSKGAGGPYEVRAIFDNGASAVPGEEVRIAGAPVGSIQSLDITRGPQPKAAITLDITDARFTPWYANASCSIRIQSLIGEKYVDCDPGTSSQQALARIKSGPGHGTYYLPVTRTHSPVDFDIVQNIYQEPVRQEFALILDELGTGLAARGSDLNSVIHRANPGLQYTDQVFQILGKQNRQLAQLATDSKAVLEPLARAKKQLSDFIVQANTTSVASAARAADISRSFQLFPSFLRQLRPLMVDLAQFADQGTPLMSELGKAASGIDRQFQEMAPFARVARKALIDLGSSSAQSQPALLQTIPLDRRLENVAQKGAPAATLLDRLTASLDQTGAIEQFMGLLFYGTTAANGFDKAGHYVRTETLVGGCTGYAKSFYAGCSAKFRSASGASDVSAASPRGHRAPRHRATSSATGIPGIASIVAQATQAAKARQQQPQLAGLLHYLLGAGQ